jgi:hypothetical protein
MATTIYFSTAYHIIRTVFYYRPRLTSVEVETPPPKPNLGVYDFGDLLRKRVFRGIGGLRPKNAKKVQREIIHFAFNIFRVKLV